MYRLLASLCLICVLFGNGVTSMAQRNHPKRQKSSRISERKELAARRALLKRKPGLAGLFTREKDLDGERTDQPREALEWYLKKRLPKGEKILPLERYFQAKEKIKKMRRFSTARNKNLPSQAEADDADEILEPGDGEFPNGTGGGADGDGSASTSGALGTW